MGMRGEKMFKKIKNENAQMAESQKPERETIERKMADPKTGLTSADVQIRTDKGWTNAATPPPSKTIKLT